ncbi:MAG: hypothetical protein R6V23_13225, partial [Bacteroidales bacterium]
MKTIYKLLITMLVLFATVIANTLAAQTDTLYIVDVVFIDIEGTGRSNAVEIEFNQPVDDASVLDANEYEDWIFANDFLQQTGFPALNMYTEVEYIANASVANDKYIRIYFGNDENDFPTDLANNSSTPIYVSYTDDPPDDDVYAYYDNTAILQEDTIKARDMSGPAVQSATFSAIIGVLKIDDTFTVEFTVSDSITTSGAQCLINNKDRTASLTAISPSTFQIDYTVAEGDNDILEADSIPLYIMVYDTASNAGTPYEESDPSPGIDATKPTISSVTFNPGDGTTLGVGDDVILTLTAGGLEQGLKINAVTVNGKTISSISDKNNGTYTLTYTIDETNSDVLDGSEVIPFSIILDDVNGNASVEYTHNTGSLSIDATDCPGIDANSPSISSVSYSEVDGTTLGIGESVILTVTATGNETGLTAETIEVNGKAATGFNDEGDGTYTMTYTVAETDTDIDDATEALPINLILNDGYNLSTPYTTSTAATTPGVDGNRPTISNVAFSPPTGNTIGINDVLTLTVTASESGLTADQLSVNGKTDGSIGAWTYISDNDYNFTYTVNEGHNDISDASVIPFSITLNDGVNASDTYTDTTSSLSIDAADCPGIDATRPTISSVSFTPSTGTLGEGDLLTVNVTAGESGLTANQLSVNGQTGGSIGVWTPVSGNKYSFTYTVVEGHPDISDASVIPFSIVLDDSNGNASATYTESTISLSIDATDCPGIDANSPSISSVSYSEVDGTTLGIGESVILTVTATGNETGLTAETIEVNGKAATGFNDEGDGTYTMTYTVAETDTDIDDATEALPINLILNDGYNLSTPYTTSTAAATPGVDGNRPTMNGISCDKADGTTVAIGETITVTITAGGGEEGLTASTLVFNGQTITGGLNDVGGGSYTFTYTIEEGDGDILDDTQMIPFSIVLNDGYNDSETYTQGTASLALTEANFPGIDATRPTISSVTFSPGDGTTLGVGDDVILTLTAGGLEQDLTINAVTVNGKTISSISDKNNGTYTLTYTIDETNSDVLDGSEVIPFSIILDDVNGNASVEYTHNTESLSIDATDCPGIDANSPEINNIYSSANTPGVLKVNDNILFTIEPVTPETNLSFTPDSYNGGDLAWSTSDGGATYTATYSVEEGQTDRPTAFQLGNVFATDQFGNTSTAYDFQDIQKSIDANTPTITDFIVPENKMLLGDTVQATIIVVSDTGSYILNSGNVAGFPIDSIVTYDDATYYAFFKITNLGYDIQPNQDYSVDNLVLTDFAGNTCDPYSKTISQPNDPIYTNIPTGKVTGKYHECEGDTVELKMQFTGSGPWDIELFNGSSTTVVSGITDNLYYHKLKTENNSGVDADTIIYKINKVTDVNGNVKISDGLDSAIVYVHLLPIADISYPANGRIYNISNQKDTLKGNELLGVFSGSGIFSGNGVLSATSNFFPPEAGTGTHIVTYTYTTEHGCSDSDSIEITVIEASGSINFPDHSPLSDYLYCNYESAFMITGNNINAQPGSFYIKDYSGTALVNTNTDTAYIDPGALNAGDYTVIYTFDDGGIVEIPELFTIDSVGIEINFTDIPDQCADYDTINVEAVNLYPLGGTGKYEFSGSVNAFEYDPAVPQNNKIYFLEDSVSPGNYQIDYYYTAPSGCKSDTITKSLTVNALPNVSFDMNSIYNIEQGESLITGNPAGSTGLFTPLSYMSNNGDGTASFDPEDAGLGDHTATYTYTDPVTGCENLSTSSFTVSEAEGEITNTSGSFQYCYYGSAVDTIVGIAYNSDGTDGVFHIDGELVAPFAKDSIIINPSQIGAGNHTISFIYTNQTATYHIQKSFNIDSIGNMSVGGFDDEYCEDDETMIELNAIQPSGDLGTNIIFGNGISQDNGSFYFTPSEAQTGYNNVYYTFVRNYSGCTKTISDSILINQQPYVNFTISDSCFVEGEAITFISDTLASDSVVQWSWLFDGF